MNELLTQISGFIWGIPLILLLGGTGIYLTIKLKGIQFRYLGRALELAFIKRHETGEGDISHFEALTTALSSTVGVGNIVGVATAIATGGPGALFWMWIIGWVGMATKYSEAILAVRFRVKDSKGLMCGGPMYYISHGPKLPWLGTIFAILTAIAAFGIGNMVQANSVADAAFTSFDIPQWLTGIIFSFAVALIVIGGIKSIGRTTGLVLPFIVGIYILACLTVVITNIETIPATLWLIIKSAFTTHSALGGFAGATVMTAVRMGLSRGIFSNEAGLGSSPIAAAAAITPNPVNQALVSMTQTFIDTVVICMLTGIAIINTGVWTNGTTGAALSVFTFNQGSPANMGHFVIFFSLLFFAYATVLAWEYYGERAVEYLFGWKGVIPYRVLWIILIFIGTVLELKLVWSFADIMNALMAIPNLIALIWLSKTILEETKKYLDN